VGPFRIDFALYITLIISSFSVKRPLNWWNGRTPTSPSSYQVCKISSSRILPLDNVVDPDRIRNYTQSSIRIPIWATLTQLINDHLFLNFLFAAQRRSSRSLRPYLAVMIVTFSYKNFFPVFIAVFATFLLIYSTLYRSDWVFIFRCYCVDS
jgi:hypothetical protein